MKVQLIGVNKRVFCKIIVLRLKMLNYFCTEARTGSRLFTTLYVYAE